METTADDIIRWFAENHESMVWDGGEGREVRLSEHRTDDGPWYAAELFTRGESRLLVMPYVDYRDAVRSLVELAIEIGKWNEKND